MAEHCPHVLKYLYRLIYSEYSKVPSFACFRWLFWRTQSTLKFLNQVRPMTMPQQQCNYDFRFPLDAVLALTRRRPYRSPQDTNASFLFRSFVYLCSGCSVGCANELKTMVTCDSFMHYKNNNQSLKVWF